MNRLIRRLTPWPVIALSPLLLIPVGLWLAPHAHADGVENYAGVVAPAVCSTLDDYPTIPGLLGVLNGIAHDSGFSAYDAGRVVGMSVYGSCPRHAGLVERFVAIYLPQSVDVASGSMGGVI